MYWESVNMRQISKWAIALCLVCAAPAYAAERAGEVSSVVGAAVVTDAQGGKRAVAQGMLLHVGDVLKTGGDGRVHLRMVDDALLSVRPDSEIRIAGYTYRPGEPSENRMRFDLLRGTVRSVTGKGGEMAKDKFRMNTPVAAIGVRGTDFVAQADATGTWVNVQSGAIVLAPFGEGCAASALGPCQTAAARTLGADMSNMMLEFTNGMTAPRLVPLSEKMQIVTSTSQASGAVAHEAQAPSAPDAAPATIRQQLALSDPAVQPATPVTPVPVTPTRYQMVWGHWAGGTAGNDLALPYRDALQGRQVTVGNAAGGLFRDAGAMAPPLSGRTQFTLRQAQVSLAGAAGVTPGQVQSGQLGVDFGQKQFDTSLNIAHPSLAGPATLNARGIVRDDGILLSRAANSNGFVAGSLSRDAAEAGYLFELPTSVGTLAGTTLWIK